MSRQCPHATLGSVALALLLLMFASPAFSQKSIITSDCPDGAALCRLEIQDTAADSTETAPTDSAVGVVTGVATGGVLALTNLDVGVTRDELLARVEPKSPPPTEAEATANESVPDWGSGPARTEVWVSEPAKGEIEAAAAAPATFADCMERAIRGEVPYANALRVCEVLFRPKE